ncbi:unnamed protein product [Chrysodeixis includens]|uniref:Uncharacterized protein n=1 Tax=Chrysodeixis includens TaxID=689277 RepID=A0A9N8KQP7_CHRIL|nr:unnamed protein product [Chrysodeixis includens]
MGCGAGGAVAARVAAESLPEPMCTGRACLSRSYQILSWSSSTAHTARLYFVSRPSVVNKAAILLLFRVPGSSTHIVYMARSGPRGACSTQLSSRVRTPLVRYTCQGRHAARAHKQNINSFPDEELISPPTGHGDNQILDGLSKFKLASIDLLEKCSRQWSVCVYPAAGRKSRLTPAHLAAHRCDDCQHSTICAGRRARYQPSGTYKETLSVFTFRRALLTLLPDNTSTQQQRKWIPQTLRSRKRLK